MPSAKEIDEPGHVTTGNVLEDLGFSAREIQEMEIKHDLWVPIRAEIEARGLTQAQLARELRIHQPDASLLLRGQITRFSITRLLQFADSLHLAVTFSVARKTEGANIPVAARIRMRRPADRRKTAKLPVKPRAMKSVAGE